MPKIVKLPKPIYNQLDSNNGLKPGDILIMCQNPYSLTLDGRTTRKAQAMLNEEGGHSNTEHAAMVIEVDGKLKMVHLRGVGFRIEDLNTKRTKFVYRIKNPQHRATMVAKLQELIDEKKLEFEKKMKWRYIVSFTTFIRRLINSIGIRNTSLQDAKKQRKHQNIAGIGICSKFVADCFAEAAFRAEGNFNYRQLYMNIFTYTSPKTLQAYLDRNTNYESFMVPQAGDEIYQKMLEVIQKQISRLENKEGQSGKKKAEKIKAAIQLFEKSNDTEDPYKKSRQLMQQLKPLLMIKRRPSPGRAKSYGNVLEFAKSQGIYPEYFNQNVAEESESTISKLMQDLRYNDNEKNMYHVYRTRGYSNPHAQFKVRPSMGSWMALNPRRITAVSLLLPVLGIFSVLIYGAANIVRIKRDHKKFSKKNDASAIVKQRNP